VPIAVEEIADALRTDPRAHAKEAMTVQADRPRTPQRKSVKPFAAGQRSRRHSRRSFGSRLRGATSTLYGRQDARCTALAPLRPISIPTNARSEHRVTLDSGMI